MASDDGPGRWTCEISPTLEAVPMLFDCCRDAITELVEAGADVDAVERAIETCGLDRDEKDALWLWLWGLSRPKRSAARTRFATSGTTGVPRHAGRVRAAGSSLASPSGSATSRGARS